MDTTTHAALALPASDHGAIRNESHRITVKWGGGQARVHVRQFQPYINYEYDIPWNGDAANADPSEILREVLTYSADEDDEARLCLLVLGMGELDWYAPVSMRRRDRELYWLTGATS
ncbi:hypothetical protein [Streptomyces variabilis]